MKMRKLVLLMLSLVLFISLTANSPIKALALTGRAGWHEDSGRSIKIDSDDTSHSQSSDSAVSIDDDDVLNDSGSGSGEEGGSEEEGGSKEGGERGEESGAGAEGESKEEGGSEEDERGTESGAGAEGGSEEEGGSKEEGERGEESGAGAEGESKEEGGSETDVNPDIPQDSEGVIDDENEPNLSDGGTSSAGNHAAGIMSASEKIEKEDEASPSEATKLTTEEIDSMEVEELYEILLEDGTEEGWNHVLGLMTAEKLNELIEYLIEIGVIEEPEVEEPETVEVTDPGPFLEFIGPRRMMTRAVTQTNSEEDKGLYLNKTVETDKQGNPLLRLEAYTTGKVTTATTTNPLDIVLVLDQSGSMAWDFGGNDTNTNTERRQYAVKEAVKNFINAVYEKTADADGSLLVENRMGIVTFGTTATSLRGLTAVDDNGRNDLIDAVNGLPDVPSGATRIDYGVEEAADMLADSVYNEKVVIIFTDGVPADRTEFNIDIANGAIEAANKISDATIYTVGIFGGANPNELHGAYFDRVIDAWDVVCSGEVGSIWGKSNLNDWFSGDVLDIDIPAGNRFLNYLSSNYDAEEIGIESGTYAPETGIYEEMFGIQFPVGNTSGKGYQITENYERNQNDEGGFDNYYLTAGDADSLKEIFQTISEQISTPDITLGSDTIIRDVISPYFMLPEGTNDSSINCYTVPCTGGNKEDGFSFDQNRKIELLNVSIDIHEKTIDVTGYDFNANFVAEEAKSDGSHGEKLVIEIPIEADYSSGTFGGEDFITNDAESGVYRETEEGVEESIKAFNQPTASIPVRYCFDGQDMTIYLGNGIDSLENLLESYVAEGESFTPGEPDNAGEIANNEKVTIIYKITCAGEDYFYKVSAGTRISDGTWVTDISGATETTPPSAYLKEKKECTISAVIISDGNANNKANALFEDTKDISTTANIYVSKPQIPFSDSSIYLGEMPDYSKNRQGDIEWRVPSSDIPVGETSPEAVGTSPAVTITGYRPAFNVEGAFEKDTDVKVTEVVVGSLSFDMEDSTSEDYGADHITFTHTRCGEVENCGFDPNAPNNDKQFRVHVKPCTLTIQKRVDKLENTGQTFIFNVEGPNSSQWQVAVKAAGETTLTGLPIGEYTVTELEDWSWRYEAENGGVAEAALSKDEPNGSVTITNSLQTSKWLTHECLVTNTFDSIASDSSFTETTIVADVKSLRAMRGE
ncbi:vWA domain-containing protein, partial [Clostridium porci]|uniref:vWA domain-containing protein n=1 Tax=Clostridium porci TaxID=2605778 RepID=UPI003A8D1CF0